MQKTKLGVSVGVLGAAAFFLGLFSGSLAAVILTGYILLREENVWLRKSAVKAVALLIVFALFNTVLGLIPDVISFINSILSIFGGSFYISVVSNIIYMLRNGLELIRTVLFLLLGLKALNQGTVRVPVIDSLVDKCMQ
ncbi:MAG: hypothetical protein NC541_00830 [bacterium]|nr:hypothetical protein [bacterium]